MNPDYRAYQTLIGVAATTHGLDPAVVAATCQIESAFRTDAFRHEQQFWVRYMAKNPAYSGLHPRRYSSSYGLLQIMWVVAVENGFDSALPPEHLFVPEVGLEYGCRRLAKSFLWAKQFGAGNKDTTLSALAAYNGGMNASQAPPTPRNLKYALKVWSVLPAYQ